MDSFFNDLLETPQTAGKPGAATKLMLGVTARAVVTSNGETRFAVKATPAKCAQVVRVAYQSVDKPLVDANPVIQKARATIAEGLRSGAPTVEISLPSAKEVVASAQKTAAQQPLGKDLVSTKAPKESAPQGAPKPTEAAVSLRPKEAAKSEKQNAFPESPAIELKDHKLAPQLDCYKDTRAKMHDQYKELNTTARAVEELGTLLKQVFRLDASCERYFNRPGFVQTASFQRELFLSMLLVRSNPIAAMRLLGGLFGQPTEMIHLIRLAFGQGLISKESAEKLQQLLEQPEIVPMLHAQLELGGVKKRKKSEKDQDESSDKERGNSQHDQQPSEHEEEQEEELLLAELDAIEKSSAPSLKEVD